MQSTLSHGITQPFISPTTSALKVSSNDRSPLRLPSLESYGPILPLDHSI